MLSNVIFYELYYFTFHILVYSPLLSMYGRGQGYCLSDIQMGIQLAKYHSFLKSPFPIVLCVIVVLCHRCMHMWVSFGVLLSSVSLSVHSCCRTALPHCHVMRSLMSSSVCSPSFLKFNLAILIP